MNAFRWSSVVFSLILGLGMTHLLSSTVGIFRVRGRETLDWIPFAWAGCVFIWQLQFWWAIIELPCMIHSWDLGAFLIMVVLTILLYLAASLVLPPAGTDLTAGLGALFARDGRWALVALSVYNVGAVLANWMLWDVSPISWVGVLLTVLAAIPLTAALNARVRLIDRPTRETRFLHSSGAGVRAAP